MRSEEKSVNENGDFQENNEYREMRAVQILPTIIPMKHAASLIIPCSPIGHNKRALLSLSVIATS